MISRRASVANRDVGSWGDGRPDAARYSPLVVSEGYRRTIRDRLAAEVGRLDKDAPFRVALAYPSPYHIAMSSLGYQQVYRLLQGMDGVACERVFLPDDAEQGGRDVPVSYETLRPVGEFPLVAVSVAYELEIAGLVRLLTAAGIPPLARDRNDSHPVVLAGGPLTFSNPVPLGPYVDAIVMGEAEDVLPRVIDHIGGAAHATRARELLADEPHVYVPAQHGERPLPVAQCDAAHLPAVSAIRTPHTELSDMFLLEAERGCSRGCTYCVMRRSTNGGMRIVPADTVLAAIPEDARKVGLVGAAVSDHPRIAEIVGALAERGVKVGLSSLRPDRLKEEFVAALKGAGYKTLTTALDGASERLRHSINRRGYERHYRAAAERARRYGFERLKLYLMIGLPEEHDADLDECAAFVGELSRTVPIALGISPFCAKRHTPLDGAGFAGVRTVNHRLSRLRKGLQGRADLRATSARWAWVEHVLAQGGFAEGEAVGVAVARGGRYSDFRAAFADLGHDPDAEPGRGLRDTLAVQLNPTRLGVLSGLQ
jgi:radical SAM superfamily enzyme YgiQ (UPF0313 family)